jgi:hypothetical protein
MRHHLLPVVGLSLLSTLALPTASEAAPIRYDVVFSIGPTSDWNRISGSFLYDAEAPHFTEFYVVWGPQSFDLTAAANGALFGPSVPTCPQGASCAFAFLTDAILESHENTWSALQTTHAYTFTFLQTYTDSGAMASLAFSGEYDVVQLGNSTNTGRGTWFVAASQEQPTSGMDSVIASTVVPEPGTLSLLLLSAVCLAGWRSRDSRCRPIRSETFDSVITSQR